MKLEQFTIVDINLEVPMRHMLIIVSALVLSAPGLALADDTLNKKADEALFSTPAPQAEDDSCEVKTLPECQQALQSCQRDQESLLTTMKQCPGFEDMTNVDILVQSRTGAPPTKPVLPVKPATSKRIVVTKTPTTTTPKPVKVYRKDRFATHAGCPVGGVLYSAILGDKVQNTMVVCDGAPGPQGPKGDTGVQGPQGLPGMSSADSGRDGQDGRDGTKVGIGLAFSADVIDSKSQPHTSVFGFGLGLRVQHGRYEWSAAALWAPGRDHGTMLKTDLTAYVWKGLGVTGGAELIYAGINDQNKANSQFVLGTIGPSFQLFRKGGLKAQVEAHVSYGAAGAGGTWTSASGYGASGGLVYEF